MAGVNLKHRFSRVSLFPSEPFQLVNAANPPIEDNAYEQKTKTQQGNSKDQTNGNRQDEQRTSINDSGEDGLGETFAITCGKAMRRLAQWLTVSFFHSSDSAPLDLDPIRTFILSNRNFPNFPRSSSANHPLVPSPPPRVPAGPSLDEILAKTVCNLAHTKFLALWNVSGKTFVLFQDPITKSTVALSLDSNFCAELVRSHLRISREKFGIWEDL